MDFFVDRLFRNIDLRASCYVPDDRSKPLLVPVAPVESSLRLELCHLKEATQSLDLGANNALFYSSDNK